MGEGVDLVMGSSERHWSHSPKVTKVFAGVGLLTPAGPQTPLISFSVHYSRKGLRRTGPGVNSSRWQGYQHVPEYLRLACVLLVEGPPRQPDIDTRPLGSYLSQTATVRLSRTQGTIRDSSCCHFLTTLSYSSSPCRILPLSSLGMGFEMRTWKSFEYEIIS